MRQVIVGVGGAFAALAFACGTLLEVSDVGSSADASDDARLSTLDGAPDPDGASGDAGAPCDLTRPFGLPQRLATKDFPLILGTSPRLTADELTLVYAKLPKVFIATRSSTADPFGSPVQVDSITADSGAQDTDPMVSANGLDLYFVSIDATTYDVFRASRSSRNDAFANRSPVVGVNTAGSNELQPFFASNGGGLWLVRATEGASQLNKIFLARPLPADAGFDTPVPVPELDSPAHDSHPVLSADGLTIYFASDREEADRLRIFTAARSSPAAPFGAPTKVANVNQTQIQAPGWLSVDQCRLYMEANGGAGSELYIATKPK